MILLKFKPCDEKMTKLQQLRVFKMIHFFCFVLFVFFRNHSQFTGSQWKGEANSLTPPYQFYLLYKNLDISWTITVDSWPLHEAGSQNKTGKPWLLTNNQLPFALNLLLFYFLLLLIKLILPLNLLPHHLPLLKD